VTARPAQLESRPATKRSSRWAELALIPWFALLITVVPVAQLVWELGRGEPIQELELFRRAPTLERLQSYERAIEDNSVVGEAVRKRCQWLGLVALRSGNDKAVVGRHQTIFYRPSLDAVISPGFMSDPYQEGHPVDAIVAFRDSLRRHGVDLVLLVVPGKETIYPEWLSSRYPLAAGPPNNRDLPIFLAELERRGVNVVDPTQALWRAKDRAELYLRQDSHWTPQGLDIVVDELVRRLPQVQGATRRLKAVPVEITGHGDLYDMLQLPALPSPFEPQTVVIRRVVDVNTGEPFEPDPGAPIVLLGDSFTNIYSLAEMNWGDHAGLGEQLALRLGQPLDVIAQNDGGVNTARATLARNPGRLDGKKLVIWQFAARDLVVSNGEWKRIQIPND